MDLEGSFPDFAMNDENVDYESILGSFEEEQPSLLPSSSVEPCHLDDADMKKFSSSLIDLLEKQQAEVDRYLQLQVYFLLTWKVCDYFLNDSCQSCRLSRATEFYFIFSIGMNNYENHFLDKGKDIALLKDCLEHSTSVLQKLKDEKLEMGKQYLDLYESLKRAEELNDAWQRIANEKDAMISSLTSNLEQLQQTHISSTGEAVKGEHYCCNCSNEGKGEDTPTWLSYHVSTPCNCCDIRNACMLFLPCRHISACKACETSLGACLICGSEKKETKEVLLN